MELVPESFKVEQECTKDIGEKDPGDCENLTVQVKDLLQRSKKLHI